MIALLQRGLEAKVVVDGAAVGAIGHGLMVLLCAKRNDTEKEADALLAKLLLVADQAAKPDLTHNTLYITIQPTRRPR